jgi:hypothetical protein
VNNISKHGRSEVQTKYMNLGAEGFIKEVNDPINHVVFDKTWDDSILDTAFL